MKDATTVYVFDHAAGFDWYYDPQGAVAELLQHERLGWLAEGDGLYAVPVPGLSAQHVEADQDAGNAYLEAEDYPSLPGCVVLWRYDEEGR